jgi:hypothetical protein
MITGLRFRRSCWSATVRSVSGSVIAESHSVSRSRIKSGGAGPTDFDLPRAKPTCAGWGRLMEIDAYDLGYCFVSCDGRVRLWRTGWIEHTPITSPHTPKLYFQSQEQRSRTCAFRVRQHPLSSRTATSFGKTSIFLEKERLSPPTVTRG